MSQPSVTLRISFQALVEAIAHLPANERRQLWQHLNAEFADQASADDPEPYDWGPDGMPELQAIAPPTDTDTSEPSLQAGATYAIHTPLNSHRAANQLSQLLESEPTDE